MRSALKKMCRVIRQGGRGWGGYRGLLSDDV